MTDDTPPPPYRLPDYAIANALCAVIYYEGRRSKRQVAVEFADRYRRADLISYGRTLRDVVECLRRDYPKAEVTSPAVQRILKKIVQRKPGFRCYILPDERPRGIFK